MNRIVRAREQVEMLAPWSDEHRSETLDGDGDPRRRVPRSSNSSHDPTMYPDVDDDAN